MPGAGRPVFGWRSIMADTNTTRAESAPSFLRAGDRVLFEGDSLSEGLTNHYARLMRWDVTWAHLVDEWLFAQRPELNLETKNLAVGGSSVRSLLGRVDPAEAFRPGVVFFTVGTNDALARMPLDEFREKLGEWCGRLGGAGCGRFALVGGFVPFPNAEADTPGVVERCAPYWSAAREVLAPRGGVYIDVGPYVLARAKALEARWPRHTVYSAGVHYNALGNQLIAGAVLTQLGYWRE